MATEYSLVTFRDAALAELFRRLGVPVDTVFYLDEWGTGVQAFNLTPSGPNRLEHIAPFPYVRATVTGPCAICHSDTTEEMTGEPVMLVKRVLVCDTCERIRERRR